MQYPHLLALWRYLTGDQGIKSFLALASNATDAQKMAKFALEKDLDTPLSSTTIPLFKIYPDDGMVTNYIQEKEFFIVECYHGTLRQAMQGMDLVTKLLDNEYLPGYPKGWEITLMWQGGPISTGVMGVKGFRIKLSQLVQKS